MKFISNDEQVTRNTNKQKQNILASLLHHRLTEKKTKSSNIIGAHRRTSLGFEPLSCRL